jgi:hypothetical protein
VDLVERRAVQHCHKVAVRVAVLDLDLCDHILAPFVLIVVVVASGVVAR